jgi:RNA-binding protein
MAPMTLAENQLRFLRGRAHALKPVVMIGQAGLTDGIVAETGRALHDHELIKVRVRGAERSTRDALLAELARRTAAELVTRIGHVAVLYRRREREPRLPLPDPARAAQT